MGIQVTPIPQLIELAVPAFTLGLANTAGSATTAVASDSALLAFDTTLPANIGTSGATGSATVAVRRDHVHGAGAAPVFGRVVRTAGDITTTSTVLEDLTGATLTLTTGAFPLQYALVGVCMVDQIIGVWINVELDGGLLLGSDGIGIYIPVSGNYVNASFSGQTAALSAASHTILVQWKIGAGTGTMRASTNQANTWSAFEIR